jgi:hypothetical protein
LRFSSPSPPPGWAGDFHPQAVEHVPYTNEKPASLKLAGLFYLLPIAMPASRQPTFTAPLPVEGLDQGPRYYSPLRSRRQVNILFKL